MLESILAESHWNRWTSSIESRGGWFFPFFLSFFRLIQPSEFIWWWTSAREREEESKRVLQTARYVSEIAIKCDKKKETQDDEWPRASESDWEFVCGCGCEFLFHLFVIGFTCLWSVMLVIKRNLCPLSTWPDKMGADVRAARKVKWNERGKSLGWEGENTGTRNQIIERLKEGRGKEKVNSLPLQETRRKRRESKK